MATAYSNASISDSSGKLLFYTDGDSLYRPKAKSILLRKRLGISSGAINQACLIIPDSKNESKYWVVVVFIAGNPKHKNVLVTIAVDMQMDNGNGNIDTTSFLRIDTLASSTISAMQHADGKRNWLIGRRYGTDTLMAWLVDTSFHANPVLSKINSPYPYPAHTIPQVCKSSPNSEMLFWGWGQRETRCNQLLKFNRQTGEFYGLVHLVDSAKLKFNQVRLNFSVDAAFSPDNRFLYTVENSYKFNYDSTPVSVHQHNRVYYTIRQYNLSVWDSATIKNSGRVLFQSVPLIMSGANGVGSMTCQLGPDGKIYYQEIPEPRLSVMHCPISSQNNNFKFRDLNPLRKGGRRMPTLNQTFVRNAGIFQVQANKRKLCQGDTLEISGYGAGAEHFMWSVSPALPASVKVDTLTWQKISTATIPAGSYTFSCQSFSRCGDVFEKSITIQINPNPSPSQPPRRGGVNTPCLGDSVFLFVPNPEPGVRYFWSTGDSTSSIVVKQTGLYSLDSVSNSAGCGIKVGDTVAVTIKNVPVPPVPVIASPPLVEICQGAFTQLSTINSPLSIKNRWSNGVVGDSVVVGSGQFTVYSENAEGCQSGSSDTVRVLAVPLPVVQIVAMDSVRCEANEEEKTYQLTVDNGQLTVGIQGGEIVSQGDSTITVRWWAIDGGQLTVDSWNALGCKGERQIFKPKTDLEICRSLYPLGIPNLITPNGDQHNELWELTNIFYYQPISLSIFNRWGKLIYETSDYRNNWPEQGLEAGTYFYRMFMTGKAQSGWVEVVR
jgi:gliding motility-associated-like protein